MDKWNNLKEYLLSRINQEEKIAEATFYLDSAKDCDVRINAYKEIVDIMLVYEEVETSGKSGN